ncbi:MAG: hypothetical protein R6U31_02890 [bacterium]
MKQNELTRLCEERIRAEFPEFSDIEPRIETIDTDVKKYSKQLGRQFTGGDKKMYGYVYEKHINDFKKILRIVIDENGNIIKITHSK